MTLCHGARWVATEGTGPPRSPLYGRPIPVEGSVISSGGVPWLGRQCAAGHIAIIGLLLASTAMPSSAEARPLLFKMLGALTSPLRAVLGGRRLGWPPVGLSSPGLGRAPQARGRGRRPGGRRRRRGCNRGHRHPDTTPSTTGSAPSEAAAGPAQCGAGAAGQRFPGPRPGEQPRAGSRRHPLRHCRTGGLAERLRRCHRLHAMAEAVRRSACAATASAMCSARRWRRLPPSKRGPSRRAPTTRTSLRSSPARWFAAASTSPTRTGRSRRSRARPSSTPRKAPRSTSSRRR